MNIVLLITGIASGFFHSLYSAVSKSVLKNRIPNSFLFLFYINIFVGLVSLPLWIFVKPVIPVPQSWYPLFMAGFTCAIAYLFLYWSLSCGDVSSVMPIMGSKVIFTGILAFFMLGELHGWPIYVAIVITALSIAILSYSPSKPGESNFPLKPIILMLTCSLIFGFTDIYIKRSLAFLDSYNFMVYYNLIVAAVSLTLIPFLKFKKIPFRVTFGTVGLIVLSAVFVLAATLLLVITFNLADGVVIPNILMSTRGVFIVIISAALTLGGGTMLDKQSKKVYLARFTASLLIILSVWITLK